MENKNNFAYQFLQFLKDFKNSSSSKSVVWSPTPQASLRNNGLTAAIIGYNSSVRASQGKKSGKWYWEITLEKAYGNMIGIIDNHHISRSCYYDGKIYLGHTQNNSRCVIGNTDIIYDSGDIIGLALNLELGYLQFYKNGVRFLGRIRNLPRNNTKYFPCILSNANSPNYPVATANFGNSPFFYKIPENYRPYSLYR
ncbi:MAG: hypothetical protein LBR98_01245 [Syntrophomonadaceae bacterium]|jgi:hypothetical protein|nr:hypothetical protein [Syntrophomonadaceae bacterium]